jgi:hypothetical protein|nr:MAG TPA: hypothetical protein [Caudoviricetes sp.]
MIKQHVSYEDYDGNKVEKDLWFHLNKSDLAKMSLGFDNGLIEGLTELQQKGDKKAVAEFIDNLLVNAYGVRKPGSDVFLKTPEIKEDFQYSLAHDEILMMLLGGEDDEIINFIVGIMPGMSVEDRANVIEQVKNAQEAKKLSESIETSENA